MRYFIGGFLLAFLGCLAFIMLVHSTKLREHVDIASVPLVLAKQELMKDCHDVYIIGDSSGNGLDQDRIGRSTGKKVLNISISGYTGWRAYRNIAASIHKQGCRPDMVVVYLTVRDIFYDGGRKQVFDSFFVNLAFGGPLEALRYIAAHPQIVPRTAITTLANARPGAIDFRLPVFYNQSTRTDIDYDVGKDCNIEHPLTDGQDLPSFTAFKNEMKSVLPETLVIFVAAPLPDCTTNKDALAPVNDYVDHGIDYLPNRYFRDYTHLSRKGVNPASDRLIAIIKARKG